MTNQEIKQFLTENATKDYSEFSGSLIPGCENMLGVRIPVLRKLAKELAKAGWRDAMQTLSDDSFEEIMLQGMILGYARTEFTELKPYLENFIPKIDNWSVNDCFCATFKTAKKNQDEVWEFLMQYKNSDKEFEQRVVAIMLMNYYLDEAHINQVLAVWDEMKHDGYYQKMGIAWGVATAYVKFREQTLEFLKNNHLDNFTYNKAIQKMLESFRVPKEDKEMLRGMKRKC